jgi:class 3 adenylate cyclase
MSALSFRFKLLFAMMAVVAGVSVSTLYVTQEQVQLAYDGLFADKVESEINYIPQEQEARLSNIRITCAKLAKSVRLTAALLEDDVEDLYRNGGVELRSILQADEADAVSVEPELRKAPKSKSKNFAKQRTARARNAARERAKRSRVAELFRFLDAKGNLLLPEKKQALNLGLKPLSHPDLEAQLRDIGAQVAQLESQQVGYVYLDPSNGKPRILEVVVTPIIDEFDTGEVLGALVVGLSYPDFGERTISEVSDIQNGLWLDDTLHSTTIPKNFHAELSSMLNTNVIAHLESPNDLIIERAGVPYRVFYTALNPESQLSKAYKVGLFSWALAVKAESELRDKILMFTGLAVVIALVISLLLSHGLSVPLNQLVKGTEAIKRGDYEVKVSVGGSDELGQLAASFNEMADGLALKERYHNVLNMVTEKDVAAELMSGDVVLGGEKRQVSVLFCDIRGFTALTQNMDPHDVIAMLNEHMTALADVVTENSGVIDKFVGDEIMAVFGAPKSYADDVYNAVRAGMQMISERLLLNDSSRYDIEIGIGISTGEVVAGNMGSDSRLNYTVLGERVNLGARLCGIAARGEVVIDETTRATLGDKLDARLMDPLHLKGISNEVKAYTVSSLEHSAQAAKQTSS